MAKIERVVKGESPSLLDADKANELIDMINGILKSKAQDPFTLKVDDSGAISVGFNLSPIEGIIVVDGVATNRIVYVQIPSES